MQRKYITFLASKEILPLIREYLKLINEVYKDVSEIKEYLIEKGVRF